MDTIMDSTISTKYLLQQLVTARNEINNLRQEIKSLRYVHEKDVNRIKRLFGLSTSGFASYLDQKIETGEASALLENNEAPTSSSTNDTTLAYEPIGIVSTGFPNKRATPRQPTICSNALGKLTLYKSTFTNPEHALQGLEGFSHMWILFHFHRNEPGHIRAKVTPPRLNGEKTGVFSTRSPHRPCPIGLSLVKIIKLEGCAVYFEGVDMVDKTPVLDIKPYIPHYDNPLYIEKAPYVSHLKETAEENNRTACTHDTVGRWTGTDRQLATSSSSNAHAVYEEIHDSDSRIRERQSVLHPSPISSSSDPSSLDTSRDEELASRLQAEEFWNAENHEDASVLGDNELASFIGRRTNSRLINYNMVNSQAANTNHHYYPESSRFLDGADGPNAVCENNLDLVNRPTSNLRLDDSSSSSSPIRMGVREAPDGEENFNEQQTNTQVSNNAVPLNANINSRARQIGEHIPDATVRVPDWISRPNASSLAVIFNERSLLQLQEIAREQIDEKKQAVENTLREDPRSLYLRQRYGNQFYTFLIYDLHITCKFDDERKTVTVFQIRHAGRICDCGEPEWQCTGHSPLPTFNSDQ